MAPAPRGAAACARAELGGRGHARARARTGAAAAGGRRRRRRRGDDGAAAAGWRVAVAGSTAAAARTCSGGRTARCRCSPFAGGPARGAAPAAAARGGLPRSPASTTTAGGLSSLAPPLARARGRGRGRWGCAAGAAAAPWRPCSPAPCRSRPCTRHRRCPRCRTWAPWVVSAITRRGVSEQSKFPCYHACT